VVNGLPGIGRHTIGGGVMIEIEIGYLRLRISRQQQANNQQVLSYHAAMF